LRKGAFAAVKKTVKTPPLAAQWTGKEFSTANPFKAFAMRAPFSAKAG
jgi:hypothetical protein